MRPTSGSLARRAEGLAGGQEPARRGGRNELASPASQAER